MNDAQIKLLAVNIVEQIQARGIKDSAPSLSLGEFVNRRLGSGSEIQTVAGLLQTAINNSKLNETDEIKTRDSWDLSTRPIVNPKALTGLVNADARRGQSAEGAPPMLTQGDLLMALAPVITVRGDTFRIRAYGESRSKGGNVTATARCEAVIQRVPDYLDATDSPGLKPVDLKQEVNQRFGRRLLVVSFRWLAPAES